METPSNVIAIWNRHGQVSVHISGDRVFDAHGNIVGWVRGDGVYDKSGRHIGWFAGGFLRDRYGKVLGFSSSVDIGSPHPPLPQNREGARLISLEGKHGKPGFTSSPGLPLLGGKPPQGASWSEFDTGEYFERT